ELDVLLGSIHPNLINLIDFGSSIEKRCHFLALEWIDGKDFVTASHKVSRHHFYSMITQVCRALDFLHKRGLLHGDLKPTNLLVALPQSGLESPHVKLIDFESSTAADTPSTIGLLGSPHYLAPEIIQGREPTIASD